MEWASGSAHKEIEEIEEKCKFNLPSDLIPGSVSLRDRRP